MYCHESYGPQIHIFCSAALTVLKTLLLNTSLKLTVLINRSSIMII